ncbi:MAG: HAD-IA family hydrolase [Actinomycetia bacterium]|nr:HAD-IA family hydrolase [Actinomycetes bacterium]
MQIKAVFFDVGNTLITTDLPESEVFCDVAAAVGVQLDARQVNSLVPLMYQRYEEFYGADSSFWSDDGQARQIWLQMYRYLCELLGIEDEAAEIADRVYEVYFTADAWRCFDDVLPCLERLAALDVQMGLISNWDSTLRQIVSGLGLACHFQTVLGSADVCCCKPDAAIFQIALEHLGVSAQQAVHVGDHCQADVQGAMGVGMGAVLLDRAGQHVGFSAAPRISSLGQLPGLIEQWQI